MNTVKKTNLGIIAALAVSLLAPVASQAQSYSGAFGTPVQGGAYSGGGREYRAAIAHAALNPNDTTSSGCTSPTPLDTSDYGAAFDQMKANMQSVATGPVGLGAFGLLVIGIIFGVAWRLMNKGGSRVGK